MALKIPTNSPNFGEIKGILMRFSEHAGVCDVCNVKTGAYCDIGGHILHELTKFPEVEEVPENWKPKKP